jgi:hypothetical protein
MNEGRTHGPLPMLLVGLTVVTGLVDAFSYLSLGHVSVANMTGNVVFLGFGLAGVGDVEVVASVVAVLAFAVGAALGGRWGCIAPCGSARTAPGTRPGSRRDRPGVRGHRHPRLPARVAHHPLAFSDDEHCPDRREHPRAVR